MNNVFGSAPFGGIDISVGRKVAVLGDSSDHGGTLISTNQDGTVSLNDIVVCVNQCLHSCPITGHGVTSVTAIVTKSKINGKLIITYGATAGCGAIITPPDRKVYCE
jgi:uncharacterized Zn-binding protein involved in type VI secretion